jgi:hypothetical protein
VVSPVCAVSVGTVAASRGSRLMVMSGSSLRQEPTYYL